MRLCAAVIEKISILFIHIDKILAIFPVLYNIFVVVWSLNRD